MIDMPETAALGAPVRRREDLRFVTGRGRYVDDVRLDGLCHAVVVRSPEAHADIVAIDVSGARTASGVIAVLTGEDFAADGLGDIPCESIPATVAGSNWFRTPFPALIRDRVRAVGDAVALVVAETRAEAQEAAERVSVEYRSRPAIVDIDRALAGDVLLYETAASNLCFDLVLGDVPATEAAFARADHVVAASTRQPRLIGAALEPRCSIGSFDAYDGRWTLIASTQSPHSLRKLLAANVLKAPAHSVRVIANDVGGGFGTKGRLYPEDVLVVWAARRIGRPVKWLADRTESFLADFHGRDQEAEGRIALDSTGRILAIDVRTCHNLGCRLGPATGVSPFLTARMIVGPYAIGAARVHLQGVFTNTRTTTSYRGAGRPEATFFIEQAIDAAGRALGLDPVEIRRRNLVRPEQMPYRTAVADTFDCGEFERVLDKALAAADWDGFEARRAASEKAGRLRGRGLCCFVEVAAISNERMEIHFDPSGKATVKAGTFSHGQGHETIYAQLVAGWLGMSLDDIRVVQGDTDKVAHGGGTYASRSVTVGGSALHRAATAVVDRAKGVAAWMLKVPAEDVAFVDGFFSAEASNRRLTIGEVAQAAYQPFGVPDGLGAGLEAIGYFAATPQNYPNGCHVAEVEIDPDLCTLVVDRFAAADDVGTVINPLLLEGQLHGSTAQGLGQALLERIVYDADGQLVTASFLDYGMPRARHVPDIRSVVHPVPTATNPLGVKGGAEVGTIGAPPAVLGAVQDALRGRAAGEITLPLTPLRLFEALEAGRAASASRLH